MDPIATYVILSCIHANILVTKINQRSDLEITPSTKTELTKEIMSVTKKPCKLKS